MTTCPAASTVSRHRPNRKVSREDAFSDQTPDAAYWAGFLMADGNVSWEGGASYRITLLLSSADEEHIESFRRFVGSTHGIIQTRYGTSILRFSSSRMASDLERWGVIPGKTLYGTLPKELDAEVRPHFVRGLIDGDGTISIRGKPYVRYTISVANNEAVAFGLSEMIESAGLKSNAYVKKTNPTTGFRTCVAVIGGNANVLAAISWLQYDRSVQALPRKRERAIEILNAPLPGRLATHHTP